MPIELIRELWKHYDQENKGSLGKREVRSFIKDLLSKDSPWRDKKIIEKMISEMDTNNDGWIDKEEFFLVVRKNFDI